MNSGCSDPSGVTSMSHSAPVVGVVPREASPPTSATLTESEPPPSSSLLASFPPVFPVALPKSPVRSYVSCHPPLYPPPLAVLSASPP
eukprot:4966584-Pleurochrysis_carterae.AAC.1